MTTVNNSLSWIVGLVIVVAVLALVLGVALSRTDILNFNTSKAQAEAVSAKTQIDTAKAQADLDAYRAQRKAEVAAAEATAQAQRQNVALQAVKNGVDGYVYQFQQLAQTMKQIADAKQYEAQRQTQAEVDRQKQLAQIETDRERRAAETRTWEATQAQNRVRELAQANQDMALQRTFVLVATGAIALLAVAVAVSMIAYGVFAGWGRLKVSRARAAEIAAEAQAAAAKAKATNQQEQWKKVWQAVGDLSRRQTELKNEFAAMRQAAPGITPTVPSHRNYDDLPLAG